MGVGQNAFAWRVPGMAAGALMAGLLFLLARVLFRRRSIAVIAGLLVLADGMLFAQSRIAMNDAYVALFIVAALAVFAPIWTGAWRWRGAFWVGLPLIGLLLGLALASKWVALYAIGGIALLILLRSALGRALIVVGLAAIAASLGYMGISTGPEATSGGNLAFLLLMIALTMIASAVAVLHPVAWTVEEVRIAVGGPAVAGALLGLASIALGLGPSAHGPGRRPDGDRRRRGRGVLAGRAASASGRSPRRRRPTTRPPCWSRPSRRRPDGCGRAGWRACRSSGRRVCLLGIPALVYVVSYLPWAALGNQIVTGWPAGHDGQTLAGPHPRDVRLPQQPAGDPRRVVAVVGLAGQPEAGLVLPGVASPATRSRRSTTAATWRPGGSRSRPSPSPRGRRSAGAASPWRSSTIMFASLWLPWARIDRATFQYHYYTALPFVLLALAYFAAEVWHGPTRRTWRLARGAAAGALLAPVAHVALPGPALRPHRRGEGEPGVPGLHAGRRRCPSPSPSRPSASCSSSRSPAPPSSGSSSGRTGPCAAGPGRRRPAPRSSGSGSPPRSALAALVVAAGLLPATPLVETASIPGELLALLLLGVLGPLAWVAWRATSPRRYAVGVVLAAGFMFVLFYPNIAGLPLPSAVYNWYQGLLPTWLYPFQFPVNTDPAVSVSLLGPWPFVLFVAVLIAAAVVAYSAWVWRLALAERTAEGERRRARGRLGLTDQPSRRRSGGTSAVKWAGSAPCAARRRMTNP